jgi:hypothetical protein
MTEERHAELGLHPVADPSADLLKREQIMRRTKILAVVVLVLLALGATRTVVSRMSTQRTLEEGTVERAKVYVNVTTPKTGQSGQTLSLPGTLQGYVQSPIAARASGYLRKWYRDIGTRDRPAALAGGRRAAASGCVARSREEHRRALGEPAQEGRRLAAGVGRAP